MNAPSFYPFWIKTRQPVARRKPSGRTTEGRRLEAVPCGTGIPAPVRSSRSGRGLGALLRVVVRRLARGSRGSEESRTKGADADVSLRRLPRLRAHEARGAVPARRAG